MSGRYAPVAGLISIQNYGISGNGDESEALQRAFIMAEADGLRELYVPAGMQIFAPRAQGLGNVHLRGEGRWAANGAPYRKQIIPLSAPTPSAAFAASDLIPSVHLRRFAAALNPQVVLVGDSTGVGGDAISQNDFLTPRLRQLLQRAVAGRTVTFTNASIGGSSFIGADGYATLSDYVNALVAPAAPDLVVINWGTNAPTEARIFRIQAFVDLLLALPKVPDIVFVTNLPRTVMGEIGTSDYAAASAQRDQAASAVRYYAQFYGYGLIDFHRMACMARDGFDPRNGVLSAAISSATPYSAATVSPGVPGMPLPETWNGTQDITFTIDNTGNAVTGAGAAGWGLRYYYGGYHRQYSTSNGNQGPYLRMTRASSNLSLGVTDAGGATLIALAGTGLALGSTVWTFQIQIRDGFMRVLLDGVVAWERLVPFRGGPLTPYFLSDTPALGQTLSITRYLTAAPALCAPSLTDFDMFGGSRGNGPGGGNGINHPASPLFQVVTGPVLDACNISAAAVNVPMQQRIAAAGAIDTRASYVGLTGPTSGTYAITLAAPAPTDIGRTMVIEMTGTTATNTVTLDLANVRGTTGGTTTATFDAADERLVLVAGNAVWEAVKQNGVTIS